MVGSAWPQRSEREAPGISENWFLGGGRLACEKCPKFTISLHVLNVEFCGIEDNCQGIQHSVLQKRSSEQAMISLWRKNPFCS